MRTPKPDEGVIEPAEPRNAQLPDAERDFRDVFVWLGVLAVLLVVFQYVTLAKFIVLQPGVAFSDIRSFVETLRRDVPLDAFDAALGVSILVPIGYLLAAELRRGRLTDFLSWIFEDDRRTVIALAVSSLAAVRCYFAPGDLSWAGDAPQHISYVDITTEMLVDLRLPIWTNWYGAGSPFLQFYGFLYFLVTGALNLLIRDVDLAGKLVLGLAHAASGLGVYAFVRVITRSRRAAFLAGLAYVLCFWHLQQVIVMGRHPVGLLYALLPWPYVFFERSLAERAWQRTAVTGGLCHAALVFTHPGYGLYATGFLASYALLRSLERQNRGDMFRGAAVVVVGLLVSAPHTLPMHLERATTKLSLGWSLASVDGPTLPHLLGWSNYKIRVIPLPPELQHWNGGYLGLTIVLIAIAGIGLTVLSRRRTWPRFAALSACTTLACLLPFVSSTRLFQHVPLIPNLSGQRYLVFTVFFLSVSVGVGARYLSASPFGAAATRRFTLLVGLLLLDLGPTTFQQPYRPPLPEPDPYPESARGELKGHRNFLTLRTRNPYNAMVMSQLGLRTPTARAPHPGDLLAQTYFVEPLEESFSLTLPEKLEEVDWNQLSRFVTGFRMLNVRNVHLHGAHEAVLEWNSPVLVSPRTVVLPEPGRLSQEAIASEQQRLEIEALQDDPGNRDWVSRFLSLIWILDRSTVDVDRASVPGIVLASGEADDLGTQPACQVFEHKVWNDRVRIRALVTEACYARLAYAYFPYLRVTVDGHPVEPMVTAGRYVALRLSPGEHVIELQATLSPLRKGLWLAFVVALAWWFFRGRHWIGQATIN